MIGERKKIAALGVSAAVLSGIVVGETILLLKQSPEAQTVEGRTEISKPGPIESVPPESEEDQRQRFLAIEARHHLRVTPRIEFAAGEPLMVFQSLRPGFACQPTSKDEVFCTIVNPPTSQCPSQWPCTEIAYIFKQEVSTGWMASYEAEPWMALYAELVDNLGSPQVENDAVLTVRMTSSTWRSGRARITAIQTTGTDYLGQPVRSPFSIHMLDDTGDGMFGLQETSPK